MTLAAYLAREGVSMRAFARKVGCSAPMICNVIAGREVPGVALARRIEAATGGRVKAACPKCGRRLARGDAP